MAQVQIYNLGEIERKLRAYGRRALPVIKRSLATTAAGYVTELRDKYMSGPTTSRSISARTGALRRGIRFQGVVEDSRGYVARVTTDRRYMFTHFGPRGSVTVIRPKNAKALAIPLAAAMTASGVSRGGPRSGRWGETVFIKAKTPGNFIGTIFGKNRTQSGAKAGSVRGKLIPLFALMREVRIPARIDPRDLIGFLHDTYIGNLKTGLKGLANG